MERANSYNPGARSGQLSSVISSIATNYYPQLQLHTTTITTSTTTTIAMKKALRETQTLHAGCSKAEPKILPRRRRPSRVAGQPKFNQLEMVTTFTNKLSLVRIDARNFELSWPSPAPGKGVCGGATIFGSALLQPACSVCVASERFLCSRP